MKILKIRIFHAVLLLVSLGIAVHAASAADITGFKINDTNSNGIQDSDEETLPGWMIILASSEGEMITAETDLDGFYQFLGVSAGNYTIEEVMQDGWTNTTPGLRNIFVDEQEDLSIDFTNVPMVSEDGVTLLVDGMESADMTVSINETAIYDLEVTNNEETEDTFDLQIENPDDALVTLSESSISLDPGESGNIELSVTNDEAGAFVVNIIATSQTDDSVSDSITITTTFSDSMPMNGLTLLVDGMKSAIKTIFPNEIAHYILELTNSGDAADTFDLEVDNPDNATVELSNSSIPLGPGDSETVWLNVSSSENGTFDVNVTATSQNDSSISDNISTQTNVTAISLLGIEITPSTAMLTIGEEVTMTANETDVTWFSSDTSVGTVDPDTGLFEAISPGTTIVTANKPGFGGYAIINVGKLRYVSSPLMAGYNQIIVPLDVLDLDAHRLSQLIESQTGADVSKIVMWDPDMQDTEVYYDEIGMINFDIIGGQAYNVRVDNATEDGITLVGDLIENIETDQMMITQFSAPLSGSEEVPPVETNASGHAAFYLDENGTQINYHIFVDDITNTTGAHIHMAPMGQNGSVVAVLFTGPTDPATFSGLLAEGTLTEADLTGPMEGMAFDDLVNAMLNGQTYVNIHTEQNPDGELRGQIR